MELPFPGMDPYLESSKLWTEVHSSLVAVIHTQFQEQLSPGYMTTIESYVLLEEVEATRDHFAFLHDGVDFELERVIKPELTAPLTNVILLKVPTHYSRVEIRSLEFDRLITVIEVLSPANKRFGRDGAEAYEQKRQELFKTSAHLLELDLLRAGLHPEFAKPLPNYPYFIFLSRARVRPHIDVWPLSLREEIPLVPVPLLPPDPDIVLDLGAALREIYGQAAYERRIDYTAKPPLPELSSEEAVWLDQHLKSKGLR
jgi:hypothetical protein